jgi:colicin import membrane protein
MAVTKEQIFSAADDLAAAGQRPTLEAIRQITGGSYTTISPALNEWKARQATPPRPARTCTPGRRRPPGRAGHRPMDNRP